MRRMDTILRLAFSSVVPERSSARTPQAAAHPVDPAHPVEPPRTSARAIFRGGGGAWPGSRCYRRAAARHSHERRRSMPTRNASATWEGGIKGKGSFKGASGAIGADYSFGSRFENAGGSNPEELLA